MAFTSFSTSSKTSWSTALFISLNLHQLIVGPLTRSGSSNSNWTVAWTYSASLKLRAFLSRTGRCAIRSWLQELAYLQLYSVRAVSYMCSCWLLSLHVCRGILRRLCPGQLPTFSPPLDRPLGETLKKASENSGEFPTHKRSTFMQDIVR